MQFCNLQISLLCPFDRSIFFGRVLVITTVPKLFTFKPLSMLYKMFRWFKSRFVSGSRRAKSEFAKDNPFLIL